MLVTNIFTLSSAAVISTTTAFGVVNDYLADLVVAPAPPSINVDVESSTSNTSPSITVDGSVPNAPSSITTDVKLSTPNPTVDKVKDTNENTALIMPTLVGELDEEALFAASTFPISPMDLIARAKEVLNPGIKLGTEDGGDCLADDFEFVAAVVGPIGKKEYIEALQSFRLEDNFDITPNFYGFLVDPMQTNRVWFFNRQEALQKETFAGAQPTGEKLILPPQTYHIDFNEQGMMKEFGFYTTDRRYGNTGGLGGAFGYFYGVGKPLPIPECQPYKQSKRFRLLNFLGRVGKKFSSTK